MKQSQQSSKNNSGDLQVDVRGLWLRLRANWRYVVISALAAMSFAGIYTFFFERPVYRSSGIVKLNAQSAGPMGLAGTESFLGGGGDSVSAKLQNQLDFFHSPDFTDLMVGKLEADPDLLASFVAVVGRTALGDNELEILKAEKQLRPALRLQVARMVSESVNALPENTGNTINVFAETSQPELSYRLAKLASEVLREENLRKSMAKVNRTRDFLDRQTDELRER